MKSFSVRFLVVIVVAELVSSFVVWHGTPTDWKGHPLSFWYFEMLRIRYWCGFVLAFAGLWMIGWNGLRRLNCAPYEVLHGLVLENNRFSAVRHRTPDFMRAPAILNYLTPYSVRQLDFILPEVPRYTDSLSLMKSSTSIWDTIDCH